jgi:hypothetical protein
MTEWVGRTSDSDFPHDVQRQVLGMSRRETMYQQHGGQDTDVTGLRAPCSVGTGACPSGEVPTMTKQTAAEMIQENRAPGPLGTTKLLLLAEQIDTGNLDIAEEGVGTLTRQFIELYESPFTENYHYRRIASKAAGVLASHHSEALDLVMEGARRYAEIECDIGDADPYYPNSITCLKEDGPHCEKVIAFLKAILEKYPGMADVDIRSALVAMGES